jgi:hypothetical protein
MIQDISVLEDLSVSIFRVKRLGLEVDIDIGQGM